MTARKILIIDDSQSVRRAVRSALVDAGFEVIEAVDGEEGRERIGEHADLAAVLCDVNMPRLDGLTMLESVKSMPAHAGLPVLMLTTEGEPGMVRRARAAGAAGWIVKPFQPATLVSAVRRVAAA